MKNKFTLMIACIGLISLSACKKDRVCECTNTTTSSSGNVNTDSPANITYINSTMGDAKSNCQKTNGTYVNASGGTSTYVYDCKLK